MKVIKTLLRQIITIFMYIFVLKKAYKMITLKYEKK